MNLTNILSDRQKKNLRRHYDKVVYNTTLSFHDWLKFYVDNGMIYILMTMADEKVKK